MKAHTIATIASHSCLQILHGAKKEGFSTLAIAQPAVAAFYRQFSFIDQVLSYKTFRQKQLENVVMIPHGSFVAYGILGRHPDRSDSVVEGSAQQRLGGKDSSTSLGMTLYGNKKILEIEADRSVQDQWMRKAGVDVPRIFRSPEDVDRPVIVKQFGARGGQGYVVAANKDAARRAVTSQEKYIIQEYIVGTPVYCQYFYSVIRNRLEIIGFDRRYETDVDGIGRIPAALQQVMDINPTFTVIGNLPLVVRESLLPKFSDMGERVITASKDMAPPGGLWGPFCLETIITPDQRIVVIEISARIVAGTNLYINGSPYTDLLFDEPMSMGRRIAREIQEAIKKKMIEKITT